jgi:glycosyltransferase involved in cell wall biosynthesis
VTRHPRPKGLSRRPTVTVVVPCYNYGHYLVTALGTVLRQEGVGVEVILIDDASPDGSGDLVRRLAEGDDRIRAIVHAENKGHIATYNEGLAQATGDYVVLMSADDALTPGALARATALMESEPSVGIVYGFPMVFSDVLPDAGSTKTRSWTVWQGRDWIAGRSRQGDNCIHCPEVVLRTSVQHAIGYYDAALPHSGDLEMWLRAASVSDVGRVNGPPQAYYRVHAQSMQRTVYAGYVSDLEGRLDAFEKTLVGPGARVARGEVLYAKACRALARTALGYARAAYEHGRAGEEPVAEYLAFAERVWPPSRGSRRWRAVERRAAEGAVRRGWTWKSRRVVEDLQNRVRWQYWRRYGV